MASDTRSYASCPACSSADLLTESGVDDEGIPTGLLVVTCPSCGWEVGELPSTPSPPEAEPEPMEGSMPPGPDQGQWGGG